jgi:hypothetical protein
MPSRCAALPAVHAAPAAQAGLDPFNFMQSLGTLSHFYLICSCFAVVNLIRAWYLGPAAPAVQVGLDLFNFMQSFGTVSQVGGDQLLVPANILNRWYERLSTRLRKDPDFLTRQRDKV